MARRNPLQFLSDLWNRFQDWVTRLDNAHPAIGELLLGAALVILAVLLGHIGYTLWRVYRVTGRPAEPAPRGVAGVTLLDARTHRIRAEALAREGRYAEALAHRFAGLVCELEDARAVTVHPSKTPAEYAREARLDPTGRMTIAGLVSRLYSHVFGAEPIDERGYREFAGSADLILPHVAPN